MADFLPRRDSAILGWTKSFRAQITADPALYGLTAAQATEYAALQTTFAEKMTLISSGATRTPSAIVAKDGARKNLIQYTRLLVRLVQATPSVTDNERAKLGITIRDRNLTLIEPPASPPAIRVLSRYNRMVTLRLFDLTNPTRRAKPDHVAGASVFTYIGEREPTQPGAWTYAGSFTRTTVKLNFPEHVPHGSKVWFTANWYNAKSQPGPRMHPGMYCYLDSGPAVQAA